MGQWLEDPNEPSGWRYDEGAPDGDPTVTQMLPMVAPELDAQSRAYREMTVDDIVTDQQLDAFAARRHEPLTGEPGESILLPEDYEREAWDAERIDPRPA